MSRQIIVSVILIMGITVLHSDESICKYHMNKSNKAASEERLYRKNGDTIRADNELKHMLYHSNKCATECVGVSKEAVMLCKMTVKIIEDTTPY